MSTIPVHDLELHHETRGSGPPVLFISGATGDAGHWTEVGEELSADFTVISYDRRGTPAAPRRRDGPQHRSPNRPTTPPPCWKASEPPRARSSATAWARSSPARSSSSTPASSTRPCCTNLHYSAS